MGQQNPNPQPEDAGSKQGKNKRPRPFTIECRWCMWWCRDDPTKWTDWRVSGRYRTEAERDAALDNHQRKNGPSFEYRKGAGQ